MVTYHRRPIGKARRQNILRRVLVKDLASIRVRLNNVPLQLKNATCLVRLIGALRLCLLIIRLVFCLLRVNDVRTSRLLTFQRTITRLRGSTICARQEEKDGVIFCFNFRHDNMFLGLFRKAKQRLNRFRPQLLIRLLDDDFVAASTAYPRRNGGRRNRPLGAFFRVIILVSVLRS